MQGDEELCEIISVGGMPMFIEQERITENKDVVLLRYFAGTAGTHELIDNYRACIYNRKTKQALADIYYQYQSDTYTRYQSICMFQSFERFNFSAQL